MPSFNNRALQRDSTRSQSVSASRWRNMLAALLEHSRLPPPDSAHQEQGCHSNPQTSQGGLTDVEFDFTALPSGSCCAAERAAYRLLSCVPISDVPFSVLERIARTALVDKAQVRHFWEVLEQRTDSVFKALIDVPAGRDVITTSIQRLGKPQMAHYLARSWAHEGGPPIYAQVVAFLEQQLDVIDDMVRKARSIRWLAAPASVHGRAYGCETEIFHCCSKEYPERDEEISSNPFSDLNILTKYEQSLMEGFATYEVILPPRAYFNQHLNLSLTVEEHKFCANFERPLFRLLHLLTACNNPYERNEFNFSRLCAKGLFVVHGLHRSGFSPRPADAGTLELKSPCIGCGVDPTYWALMLQVIDRELQLALQQPRPFDKLTKELVRIYRATNVPLFDERTSATPLKSYAAIQEYEKNRFEARARIASVLQGYLAIAHSA